MDRTWVGEQKLKHDGAIGPFIPSPWGLVTTRDGFYSSPDPIPNLSIRTPVTLLQVCLFDVEAERCAILCVRAFVSNNKVSWKCKLLSVCLLAFVLRRCAVQSLTIVFRQVYTTSSNDSSDIVLLHTLQQKRVNNSQQLEVGVIGNHEACNCSARRFFFCNTVAPKGPSFTGITFSARSF